MPVSGSHGAGSARCAQHGRGCLFLGTLSSKSPSPLSTLSRCPGALSTRILHEHTQLWRIPSRRGQGNTVYCRSTPGLEPAFLTSQVLLHVYQPVLLFLNSDEQRWLLNLPGVSQWVLSHPQTCAPPSHLQERWPGPGCSPCSWTSPDEPHVSCWRHWLLRSCRTGV